MKTLVLGATGTVGSNVVRELLARQVPVRVLTRHRGKAPSGTEVVVGDLAEPATLGPAFEGIEAVFMLNALSKTETHEGMMGINAARAARVKRTVYMSVHLVDRDPLTPHFASKLPIEGALKASGIAWTILRPSHFFQNDYWLRDAMLQHGVYPQPLGSIGVSRVDVRDIAEAAAVALTSGGHEGRTYDLVGPKVWTGPGGASAWSEALGKEIAYGGDDLDAWEKGALQMLPAWLVYDVKIMYRAFQEKGLLATPGDVERVTKLLGHPPRRFEDFAKETAASWAAETTKA